MRSRSCGTGCICLKVKEFEVVSSLVPLVVFVVLSRSWLRKFLLVHFEALICAKMKVLRELVNLRLYRRILWLACVDVHPWTNILRSSLFCWHESGRHFHWWRSCLVILSGKEHKIIGSSSLKLLVSNCLKVLSIILTHSWIVYTNDNIIETFLYFGSVACKLLFWVCNFARAWKLVLTCTRHPIVSLCEPQGVDPEWHLVSSCLHCCL